METLTSDTVDAANDPFGAIVGDTPPNRCTECGKGFDIKPGPGRKPKKCPDCRATRSTGSANNSNTNKAAADSAVAKKLETSINAMAAMTAMLVATRNPEDARIIASKTPAAAKALGAWGAENKTVRRYIEGSANGMAAITVIITMGDLVLSLLQNHGIIGGKKAPLQPTLAAVTPLSPHYTTEGV